MDNSIKLCFATSTWGNLLHAFNNRVVSNSMEDGCVPGLIGVTVSDNDARALLATLATAMNVSVTPVIPPLTRDSVVGTTVQFTDNDGTSKSGTLISLEGNTASVKLFDQGEITVQVPV